MPEPTKAELAAENEALRKALKASEAKLARQTAARKKLETNLHGHVSALNEAHKQQAATSEILRVISSSPTDVGPAFDVIMRSALTLSAADFGAVLRFDGRLIHLVQSHSLNAEDNSALAAMFP